ncbi:unnamed protein product [Mytilus coruscus]|uniref:C-type lectin domain-containing protein n=1 Tax=Mytilus coruscus TaxID=42192 RepID=A0A6J8C456_MYTCO|nr:unnamed protein product [Mytilus coruscus]
MFFIITQSSCRAHNSRLAEVQTKAQSDLLMNLAKTNGPGQSYWLGGRDDVIEGIWMWASTDRAFNYTDWYPGQPDNSGGNENCVHMYAAWSLKWNDDPCKTAYRFICEKDILFLIKKSSCHEHNSLLAEVQSNTQSDLLMNLAKTYGPGQNYWLGGRDDVIEGIWMWASTDRVFNYTHWKPGQPDNDGGNENCLHLFGAVAMKWNDAPCTNAYRFICERE